MDSIHFKGVSEEKFEIFTSVFSGYGSKDPEPDSERKLVGFEKCNRVIEFNFFCDNVRFGWFLIFRIA